MRWWFYKFLLAGSVLLMIFYAAACLAGFVHPARFWPFTLLALGFPILCILMVIGMLAWLFFNSKMTWLMLLVFLLGFKNLSQTIALHPFHQYRTQKDTASLRLLSWNVRGFGNCSKHAEAPDAERRQMINFIKYQQPDILMLQEFVEYNNENIYSNIKVLRDTLGFKYVYFPADQALFMSYGRVDYGCAIFSKYPLSDTTRLNYRDLVLPESALSATINFHHYPVSLFTTHLVSMNLNKGALVRQDEAYSRYDSAFIYGSSKFTKLLHYDRVHSQQALALKQFTKGSVHPVILSGDFNSIPASFAYNTLKQGLQDAFLQKGFGLGRTYSGLSPTLRIDYILADKRFIVTQFHCPKIYLSDHFPLIADVRLK